MSRKGFFMTICLGILCLGFGVLFWALTPSPVEAQCGSNPPPDSSCYTCHIEESPVAGNGEWHGIHAPKDCCARCHGGNCMSMDKELAHQDIILNPLSDIYTNCHSCHPDNYQELAAIFAAELDITPASISTPTPVPAGKVNAEKLVILPTPTAATPSVVALPLEVGGMALIIIFMFGLVLFINHLHKA